MHRIRQVMLVLFAAVTMAARGAGDTWVVEVASMDELNARIPMIGKTVANTTLPMMLISYAQQRFVRMFGKMRQDAPFRWVGFTKHNGETDVVFIYPSIDKVAKMVLNHPGAEKRGDDCVFLPKDEGRPDDMYAVFSSNRTHCAFATVPSLARRALALKYEPAGKKLMVITYGSVSATLDFDEKGMLFEPKALRGGSLAKVKSIPYIGALAENGTKHYVTFSELKKLLATLCKEVIGQAIEKGN